MEKKQLRFSQPLASTLKTVLDHFPFFLKINLVYVGLMLGACVFFMLIAVPVILTPTYVSSIISGTNQLTDLSQKMGQAILSFPSVFFILFLILLTLSAAYIRVLLDIVNTNSSSLSRFFSGFRYAPQYIVLSFMIIFASLIGLVCFIIPGIIILIRLTFSIYYLIDKDMGPIEAIKASWKLTRGFTWPLF